MVLRTPLLLYIMMVDIVLLQTILLNQNTSGKSGGVAGGKGFEPLLTDSESVVLPLDEPPMNQRAVFYHSLMVL